MKKIGLFVAVPAMLICCIACAGSGSEERVEPAVDAWTDIGGTMVYYCENNTSPGGYGYNYSHSDFPLTGAGSIVVDLNMVSGDKDGVISVSYMHPDIWGQQVAVEIMVHAGEYRIGWVDSMGSTGTYNSTGWIVSAEINSSLNAVNTVTIDYDTDNKTFEFKINGTSVLTKTFTNISQGRISYGCEVDDNVSSTNPYRFDFRTRSPHTYPN